MIFYVLKYYSAVLCIFSLGMLLIGAVCSWVKGRTLRSWLSVFGRRKNLNFIIIAVFIVSCASISVSASMSGRAKVSLIYDGASWGENPDGTRFYRGSIISESVIYSALEAGRLNISVSSAADTLSVRPVSVSGVRAVNGEFISSEYIIEYEANYDTAYIGAENMLSLVTDAYLREFALEYGAYEGGIVVTIYGVKSEIPGMVIKLLCMVSLFSLGIYSLNYAFDGIDEAEEERREDGST